MKLDWIFYGFAFLIGLAASALYIYVPGSRGFAISPYFWILVAIALFETAVMYVRGFEYGPPLTMTQRLVGFALAVGLFLILRTSAGLE
jgi:hypothetical protein